MPLVANNDTVTCAQRYHAGTYCAHLDVEGDDGVRLGHPALPFHHFDPTLTADTASAKRRVAASAVQLNRISGSSIKSDISE